MSSSAATIAVTSPTTFGRTIRNKGGFEKNASKKCPLYEAIKNDRADIVEQLLIVSNGGCNLDVPDDDDDDDDETPPLHLAASLGNASIVERLLKSGATVDSTISRTNNNPRRAGYTALHCAVEADNRDVARLLLTRGASVDAKTAAGTTPLELAVRNGNPTIADDILNHGANVRSVCDFSGEDSTIPLHRSIARGDLELTKVLLTHGAYVSRGVNGEKNTLRFALDESRASIVAYVFVARLGGAADKVARRRLLDSVDSSPEYKAIVGDFMKSCPGIFSDVDSTDNRRASVRFFLHEAVEKGFFRIVEDFLSFGDEFYAVDEPEGYTLLHAAAQHRRHKIARLLVERGANVDAVYKIQRTPFFYAFRNRDAHMTRILLGGRKSKPSAELFNAAVRTGDAGVVRAFLENRLEVNVDDRDKNGDSALHCVAWIRGNDDGKAEIATLLLDADADPNARNATGLTTLHVAVQEGHAKLVQAIVGLNDRYVDEEEKIGSSTIFRRTTKINARSPCGSTALHMASRENRWKIVNILVVSGADLRAKNRFGKTAIDLAFEYGHNETFVTLMERGGDVTDFNPAIVLPGLRVRGVKLGFFVTIKRFHVVKMTAAGLDFFEAELPRASTHSVRGLRVCRKICDEEVAKIRDQRIARSISFFDILTGSTHRVARISRNPEVAKILVTKDLRKMFPTYFRIIEYNFRQGRDRERLMNVAIESFDRGTRLSLPTEILVEGIFRYLGNDDLENLIEAKHGCGLFR